MMAPGSPRSRAAKPGLEDWDIFLMALGHRCGLLSVRRVDSGRARAFSQARFGRAHTHWAGATPCHRQDLLKQRARDAHDCHLDSITQPFTSSTARPALARVATYSMVRSPVESCRPV